MKKSKKKAFTALALSAAIITPAIVSPIPSNAATQVTATASTSTITFKDIKGHWSEAQVMDAVAKGYVNGYDDGTFKPDKTVTYAEFITMLSRALNSNESFVKGAKEQWYQPYLDVAINNGYVVKNEFANLNKNMTRADLAKVGVRGIGIANSDNNKWLYLATSNGLLVGKDSKGTLNENGTMTRAEAVTVLNRVLQIKGGETLPVDKHAIANAEIVWHKTNIFTMLPQWFRPDTIDEFVVNDAKLTSTSPDKNVVSKANKLVVIDLDDKNDPNLKLLEGRELSYYDMPNDKMIYMSIKKPNGYVILSQGQLDVKDLSKLPTRTLLGATFEVSMGKGIDDKNAFSMIKRLSNGGTDGNNIQFLRYPNQKHFEYTTGYWISKDYPMYTNAPLQIYFRGIYEWGNINGSMLYDNQYLKK